MNSFISQAMIDQRIEDRLHQAEASRRYHAARAARGRARHGWLTAATRRIVRGA